MFYVDKLELLLEYVQALVWPALIAGTVFGFRKQIRAKLEDLKEANTPVGGASFFDREAKSVEERADRAADLQEEAQAATAASNEDDVREPTAAVPSPTGDLRDELAPATPSEQTTASAAQDSDRGPAVSDRKDVTRESKVEKFLMGAARFSILWTAYSQLNSEPDFETAREVAATSPNAAVMLAYSQVEKAARAAWTLGRQEPAPQRSASMLMRDLAKSGGLGAEFVEIARNLSDLRNRVAHGAGDASADGALDFVNACERLTQALRGSALSRFRHPSNADTLRALADWSASEAHT